MKWPFIIALLFISLSSQAQGEEDVTLKSTELNMGYGSNEQTVLKGAIYSFPSYKIYNAYVDSVRNEIFFILRTPKQKQYYGKSKYEDGAHIALFDLSSRKLRWTKDLRSDMFFITDTKVIETIPGEGSICFDKSNGKRLWKTEERVYYANKNIGIAFNNKTDADGIDLNTGKKIWERHIKGHGADFDGSYMLNDSVLLIVSDGLQTINLYTGEGWAHKLAIHDTHMSTGSVLGIVAAGVVAGAIGGAIVGGSVKTLAVNSHSQVLLLDNKIYFASKRTLLCYDMQGKELWAQPLPEDSTSGSMLIPYKNDIILMNSGFVKLADNKKVVVGSGFWSSYDRRTGKVNVNAVGIERTGYEDFVMSGDTLTVLTTKGYIDMYDLKNGRQLFTKKLKDFDKSATHVLSTGKNYYVSISGSYESLDKAYPGEYFLVSSDTGILRYTPSFVNSGFLASGEVARSIDDYKGYNLLNKSIDNCILLKDKKQVAKLNAKYRAEIISDMLFDIDSKSFSIIDLKSIIN